MNNSWINAKDFGAAGSEFIAKGKSSASSCEIELDNIGNFKPGDEISASGCFLHYYGMLYNEKEPYLAKNQTRLRGEIEFRGLENEKCHQTFVLHFRKTDPVTYSWMAVDPKYQTLRPTEPTLHCVWAWQGTNLPVIEEWVPLVDGVEMRFRRKDWKPGECVSFHARNRLLATILEVRGNMIMLDKDANISSENIIVRHHDQTALQRALDAAVAEKKGLLIPAGHYRLSSGLWLKHASARIEGIDREHTILDVSDDQSAVFWIAGGKEVIIRNLSMVGHTGFLELPSNYVFYTETGYAFWPTANQQMEVMGCSAVNAVSTEYLLCEDLNVSRMASEAFYLHGSDRGGRQPYIQHEHEGIPGLSDQYQRTCIFNRCNVTDCGFNAFNNNDFSENTSILHCRVERVANFCENASRFTRMIGNYSHDGYAATICAVRSPKEFHGLGQAIITDNVFEGGKFGGALCITGGETIVSNNIFSGISKETALSLWKTSRAVVTGNVFDLTQDNGNPDYMRAGVSIQDSRSSVIADNHFFDRGEKPNDHVHGITINSKSSNIHIHDNLVENCGHGISFLERVHCEEFQSWFFLHPDGPYEGTGLRIHDNSFLGNGTFSDLPETSDINLRDNFVLAREEK